MSSPKFARALVIGASSGIGEAIARQLHREGAQVAIVARRAAELERVAGELNAVRADTAHAFPHDVKNFAEAPVVLERAVATMGGLDLVVYASGILWPIREHEYDFDKERETIEVNLLGALAWLNPVVARFEAERGGTVLGISSIAGDRVRRRNVAYATSKTALTAYLEGVRNRSARYGVRIVTAKPGYVDTRLTRGMKGRFWLVSAEVAAARCLALARSGAAEGYVPRRWWILARIVKAIPSRIFTKLNF